MVRYEGGAIWAHVVSGTRVGDGKNHVVDSGSWDGGLSPMREEETEGFRKFHHASGGFTRSYSRTSGCVRANGSV